MVVFCRIFLLSLCTALLLTGCLSIPQGLEYRPPDPRPEKLDSYYDVGDSFSSFQEYLLEDEQSFTLKRVEIESRYGKILVDYYQRKEPNSQLIFVLPVLGGRNLFANYFAEYFANNGYDTAVVHRDSRFKEPENFHEIEDVFREGVIRDRIAIDYFEQVYGKSEFGTFGISRGAINAAISAGVDKRLKYNVLALGGSDLTEIFKTSKERGIEKYRRKVKSMYGYTDEEYYDYLDDKVSTDPKYLAKYLDANNTLMFLALFDQSVPIRYGARLRKRIGRPETKVLLSGHYSAVAFTQYASPFDPGGLLSVFPIDYVESESLAFFDDRFDNHNHLSIKLMAMKLIQAPADLLIRFFDIFL